MNKGYGRRYFVFPMILLIAFSIIIINNVTSVRFDNNMVSLPIPDESCADGDNKSDVSSMKRNAKTAETEKAKSASENGSSGAADQKSNASADKASKKTEKKSGGASGGGGSKKSAEKIVNLNTASKEELMTLSGIGEKRAQDIIDFRTKNGKFTRAEDLMNINGIGEKTIEKLRKNISF